MTGIRAPRRSTGASRPGNAGMPDRDHREASDSTVERAGLRERIERTMLSICKDENATRPALRGGSRGTGELQPAGRVAR